MSNKNYEKKQSKVTEKEKMAIQKEIEKIDNGSVTIVVHEGKRTQINTKDIVYSAEENAETN